jgi:hypothetical protein
LMILALRMLKMAMTTKILNTLDSYLEEPLYFSTNLKRGVPSQS